MSTLLIIVVFFLVAACCHGLMVRMGREQRTFWLTVDYLWIGAAAVTLISAAGNARQTAARIQLASERARFEGELDHAKWWARASLQYFQSLVFLTADPPNETERRTAGEAKNAVAFYTKLVEALDRDGAGTRPWRELEASPFFATKNMEVVVQQDLVHLRRILHDLDVAFNALAATRTATEESEVEVAYRLTWPWLLCFAAALRITKVTAELRGFM